MACCSCRGRRARPPHTAAPAIANRAADAAEVATGEPSEARLHAAVDRTHLRVGETVTYTLEARYPGGVEVEIEGLSDDMPGAVVVDSRNEAPEVEAATAPSGPSHWLRRRHIRLRLEAAGDLPLAQAKAIARRADDPGAAAHPLLGPQLTLHVASHLAAADLKDDIEDLDPLEPLRRWPSWLPGAAAGLVAAASAAAVAWGLRRRRRPQRRPTPPPPVAPEVAAQAALRALADAIDPSPEAGRRLCFALSEILRAYVEARFGLNATDLTYEEIMQRLGSTLELPDAQRSALRDILRQTDAGKFARWQADEASQRVLWRASGAFVAATTQPPEAPPAAGSAPAPPAAPNASASASTPPAAANASASASTPSAAASAPAPPAAANASASASASEPPAASAGPEALPPPPGSSG